MSEDAPQRDGYERHREQAGRRQADQSREGRDIGDLPKVANPKRRKRGATDFRFFCETYFPAQFALAWSPDHLKVLAKMETAVREGGLFAMAMPRGSGKTTIAECGCLWALLNAHRTFVALIGSDEDHAIGMLESLKTELETNDTLLEDFPEVSYPIACLEGIANRCKGQLYKGERTRITWTEKCVILPTIAGSPASGSIVKVRGITGRIRGMKHKRADGSSIRPTLVILDDPQTDESANSEVQNRQRLRTLNGAILNLAGPGSKISGIMPCTVIRRGDMADQILDNDKHPEWNGERTRLVYEFPTDEKLWEEYAQLRAEGLRHGDGGQAATEFYRERREAMDAGAVVAWPERKNPDELSAIQHAMNLRLRDEESFFAEYQNEPIAAETDEADLLTADAIAAKQHAQPAGRVPLEAERLTAAIDVQQDVLYWAVCAWRDDFSGYCLDYGVFPEQTQRHIPLRSMTRTLRKKYKGAGVEGALYAGLQDLAGSLLDREWLREDRIGLKVERLLIDAGYSDQLVKRYARECGRKEVLPSFGRYFRAATTPIVDQAKRPGDKVGLYWRNRTDHQARVRIVTFDSNWWKTFLHARFATALADPGSLSLYHARAFEHQTLAAHCRSESREKGEWGGRTVFEWILPPSKPDNHWFDCLTMAAVAASIQGCSLKAHGPANASRARGKVKLSDLQREKRGTRPRGGR